MKTKTQLSKLSSLFSVIKLVPTEVTIVFFQTEKSHNYILKLEHCVEKIVKTMHIGPF
jgi:hypothetical protein